LCLSVARGNSLFGWPCKQGTVIYMALEERVADVGSDFRSLGAESSDPIFVCDDSLLSQYVNNSGHFLPIMCLARAGIKATQCKVMARYS
jgi:hypothetical protein